jgi:hypothetical protein
MFRIEEIPRTQIEGIISDLLHRGVFDHVFAPAPKINLPVSWDPYQTARATNKDRHRDVVANASNLIHEKKR